jgi:hypothetical protein
LRAGVPFAWFMLAAAVAGLTGPAADADRTVF